jgi:hypothetical protein
MSKQSYEVRALLNLLCTPVIPDGTERLDVIHGAKHAATLLFREIEKHHGLGIARWIFNAVSSHPTPRQLTLIRKYALLDMYDMMKPRNVKKLAREIAERNKNGEQLGPRGSTDVTTIERYLREALRERREGVAARTWFGPREGWG